MSIDREGFLSPDIEQFKKLYRKRFQEYFSLAHAAVQQCHALKFRLDVKDTDGQRVYAAALFLKIMMDVEATMIILEHGMGSQGRSLLRVALEASFILANMCKSTDFLRAYAMMGECQRLKLVRGIKGSKDPGLTNVQNELNDELVRELEQSVKGESSKSAEHLARNVNMDEIYNTHYRLFCMDVHTGPASLDRMFIENDAKEIIGFRGGPDEKEDLVPELLECARLLLQATRHMSTLFELSIESDLTDIFKEFARLEAARGEGS